MEDARLEEIAYLKRASDGLTHMEAPHPNDTFERRMIIELIAEGCLNGPGSTSYSTNTNGPNLHFSGLHSAQEMHAAVAMTKILQGQSTELFVSHKGRIRLARLLSEMQSQRGRDPSGRVWSIRHMKDDLRIAIIYCSLTTPVAVAYFDMNGLKTINDKHGHAAGNQAIDLYLEAVATRCTKEIEAYRGDSSDEVVVILRSMTVEQAAEWIRKTLQNIGSQVFEHGPLRASCGLVICTDARQDAEKLVTTADGLMFEAKKDKGGGTSTLMIDGGSVEHVS